MDEKTIKRLLPVNLRRIADELSIEVAMALVRHFGGERVEWPMSRLTPKHKLAKLLGFPVAKKLYRLTGYWGRGLDIPLCGDLLRRERDEKILARYKEVKSVRKTAAEFKLHPVTVRRTLKRMKSAA